MGEVLTTIADHPELAGWLVALFVLAMLRDMIAWSARRLWDWWEHRNGNGMQGTIKANTKALIEVKAALRDAADIDPPPYPQCYYDPEHFKKVDETRRLVGEIHTIQREQERQIDQGRFSCHLSPRAVQAIERMADH